MSKPEDDMVSMLEMVAKVGAVVLAVYVVKSALEHLVESVKDVVVEPPEGRRLTVVPIHPAFGTVPREEIDLDMWTKQFHKMLSKDGKWITDLEAE